MMDEAQSKIRDNMLREEEMQREAEMLLASLGISLDDISVDVPDNITEGNDEVRTGYNISRDELKQLIQIDEKKKEILRRLKEFR
jgi:hypothetical protein